MNRKSFCALSLRSIFVIICVICLALSAACSTRGQVAPPPGSASDETPEPSAPAAAVTEEPVVEPTPELSPEPTTELPPEPTPARAEFILDNIVFLGDSTTYGLGYYDIVDDMQVWTPKSGTLTLDMWNYSTIVYPETGEELLLTDILGRKQPDYLCITLGVNGVSFMNEDYFKQVYTELVKAVQELSPDTVIILNSIYPVTDGYEAKGNGINNTKISAANGWVKSVADTCGVHFLNSAPNIMNASGDLPD
ncbi:MAG: hypothetical protein IKV47_07855 [Oscillospiraceae bacterium]|nr:hypothetical protein [Oscillospiraceae bacterium]